MKEWRSYETMFSSIKYGLMDMLKRNGIEYELSDGRTPWDTAMVWHFEILADDCDVALVNGFLDKECIWHREF